MTNDKQKGDQESIRESAPKAPISTKFEEILRESLRILRKSLRILRESRIWAPRVVTDSAAFPSARTIHPTVAIAQA